MIEKNSLPKFDIPQPFLAGDFISADILHFYSLFPCKIKSAVFVLLEEGDIQARIDHTELNVKKGDIITILPETFIQICSIKGKVKLYFAGFNNDFLTNQKLFQSSPEHLRKIKEFPAMKLRNETYSFFRDMFRFIIDAQKNGVMVITPEVINSFLMLFYEQVSALYKEHYIPAQARQSRSVSIYHEFLHLLNEFYNSEHSVSFYASKVGVTQQHFCKAIKNACGTNPSDIITQILILDAKSLLKSTSMSVKQIALSLGFRNTAFFYRFFRKNVGMTPLEYRNDKPETAA